MSEIVTTRLSSIDPNPMRRLNDYPFNERKLQALTRSIEEVGLWEGVIARKAGNRCQVAFGHHRVEAAKRTLGEDGRIPLIMRDLSDEQMLQFMGRENLEDYNANFLVMLEAWEAATDFRGHAREKTEMIDIARLLGWIDGRADGTRANDTARACDDASRLIAGGYTKREHLADLSVKAVREICGRVVAQHEMMERMAKQTNRSAVELEQAKKHSGKAGGIVARDVRSGKTSHRDIRGQVDVEAYRHAKEAKKQSPLFGMFGKSLADSISRVATKDDNIGDKLREIKSALGKIELDDDLQIVKRVGFECGGAAERFEKWATVFANPKTKVVPLKSIPGRK